MGVEYGTPAQRVMKIVQDAGTGFAFPSRTVYLGILELPGRAASLAQPDIATSRA